MIPVITLGAPFLFSGLFVPLKKFKNFYKMFWCIIREKNKYLLSLAAILLEKWNFT